MKRKIVFVLLPNIHLLDFAGPAQVFYEANALGKNKYQLIYASPFKNIETAQSVTFSKMQTLESLYLTIGDLICFPGIDFKSFQNGALDDIISRIKSWVIAQKKKGVYIGSICSGALILGKMGLLNGIACTTHWKCTSFLEQTFPKAHFQKNRLYCFDKGIFTSAGMTAGIDMALALVEKWDNPLVAAKVAQEMVINIWRPETKEQKNIFLDFENHFNPDVYKAQEILANQLGTHFTIEDLAKTMNMSSRHLSRLFKHHTGQTIQAYRDEVRLEHGENLLLHTEKSIKEIATACGFENTRQFIRLWKVKKGIPPGAFRQKVS